jgi:universal stress protein A
MYKHILFATDFSPEAQSLEARVVDITQQNDAQLSVIHVIDYYPASQLDGGLAVVTDLEGMLQENARDEITACAARFPLELSNSYICSGSAKREITNYAQEIGADLIVLGSHGRHGLGLLLGSTANGVLHLAKCDVLAVRVRE